MLQMYKTILHISWIRHTIIDDLYFYRTKELSIEDFLITTNDELYNFKDFSKYDIVLFHFIEKLDIEYILKIINENKHIKYWLYLHTFFPFFEDGTWLDTNYTKNKLYLNFIKNTDFIIAQDKYSYDLINNYMKQNNFSDKKIIYIKQYVNKENILSKKINSHNFRFWFVSSFSKIKWYDFLKNFILKNSKFFEENSIEFRFYTLDKPWENVWKENTDLKEEKNKNITITYNSYDRRDIYLGIDCLIIPSIWNETWPMVLYEALANHIPVILSDQESLKEKVIDRVDSFVFKTWDERDLLKAILRMKQNYIKTISNNNWYYYNTIENYNNELTNFLNKL